jgi:hypothetical protein
VIKQTLFIFALLAAVPVSAEVFRTVEPDGTMLYTDRPTPGAQTIEVPKGPPSGESPHLPSATPDKSPPQPKFKGYEKIEIVSPANDEDIRENTGNVMVSVALTPELQAKHKLVLFLDGNKVAEKADMSGFQLTNLDRGTHELRISAIDTKGKETARSTSFVFHLMRFAPKLAPKK